MYRHTLPLSRMVSTSHGQRRILKKSPPVQKYIRQAVESGTYYYPQDDNDQTNKNQRNKAPHGSNYRDYPMEYEILTLYPPIPPPPRIPKQYRNLRSKESQHVPTEKLIQAYLKRYQQEEEEKQKSHSEQEYYEKLLGIPPPSSQTTAMGRKSAVLNKAYAFALRQYEIMRQDDTMTEQESIEYVNKLLEQEKKDKRYASRTTSAKIQQWRQQEGSGSRRSQDKSTTSSFGFQDEEQQQEESTEYDSSSSPPSNSYPSILHSKPRAIEGMTLWSQRLKAVPYREWTIGATTALDHWIARSILELEEDTWQELLQGDSPEIASQGKDIIAVRQSLFPETILDESRRLEMYGGDSSFEQVGRVDEQQDQGDDLWSSEDKSIDELLASLGGFDTDFEDSKDSDPNRFFPSSTVVNEEDVDAKVSGLVDELQNWRRKNVDSPYEDWSPAEKDDFASWLDTYVETLASNREGQVDMVATRKALLESAPIDKDESDKFWQQVRDETEAEILLQSIQKTGALSPEDAATTGERKAREAFALFQDLPYNVQLQKLVDLGTLRPIMDEYTSESERVKFLARYGEKLMEGVEMEHLVRDPDGPIRGADLGRWGEENGIGSDERFRMEMVAYGSDDFGNEKSHRARQMYRAWNTHKAGRARFEEIMFKKDRLGLRYNLDDKGKVQTTLQTELGEKYAINSIHLATGIPVARNVSASRIQEPKKRAKPDKEV